MAFRPKFYWCLVHQLLYEDAVRELGDTIEPYRRERTSRLADSHQCRRPPVPLETNGHLEVGRTSGERQ